jgi:predicted  nucleic acid-binding Zn-ribbon protein
MSDAAKAPDTQIGQLHTDRDIERLALAAADALQRLVAERHAFRSHVGVQERELMRLRATDEELRRQLTLIRESYIRLGTEFATQLQHIDEAIRKAVQAPKGPAEVRSPLAEHQRRPDS